MKHFITLLAFGLLAAGTPAADGVVLSPGLFKPYLERFNADDHETIREAFPNGETWGFLNANIPLFECPDKEMERTYYFRWWTFRKHLKQTPDGWVVTEFLPPVGWAGKHNSIDCPAGHHFREGRWLADQKFLRDYAVFWLRKGGRVRSYSFWIADSIMAWSDATGDYTLARELLPDLLANYEGWEHEHLDAATGLFWQSADRDGMEGAIGGDGFRPTINSYMYGDALAIGRLAELCGKAEVAAVYRAKAAKLKDLVQTKLWNAGQEFFEVRSRTKLALRDVREQLGFVPWYFNLPDPRFTVAWSQLTDPKGFAAPYGLTSAEQRHPGFAIRYDGHECLWNGPVWPFATSQTLTALANILNDYEQDVVDRSAYFSALQTYAHSQRLKLADGKVVAWIDEDQNPFTGDWIARTILQRKDSASERGKDYNHSTFCDLVISGLAGLRPRGDDVVIVNPLVPDDTWDYFCLDRVPYHGRTLTIFWDKTGGRYKLGAGLHVLSDGKEIAASDKLARVTGQLPPSNKSTAQGIPTPLSTAAGWRKPESNPVLGGALGTCFDVALLKEGDTFRMYFSWRPKKSIALVESKDGVHWGEPVIVLGPNPASEWEKDMNRPVVVKRGDAYHMWFTGQAKGRSQIGYATSPDGKTWKRLSDKPVLSPEAAWEKVAVMCPHVVWDEGQFRMWYSGGEQNEPNAIGYATSPDGAIWTKWPTNPIFAAAPNREWEQHKVTACQVVRLGEWHIMFYIGFRTEERAQIGLARSRDGITGWERHPANPIISPTAGAWDADACYKPFAILDGNRWLLWYNGRHGGTEQIGLALHDGEDLDFPKR